MRNIDVTGSSESSYGFFRGEKKAKSQYFPVDEQHPRVPSEVYGLTKIINEQTAEMFHQKTGMQVVSFRFSYITLPEVYPGIIESFDEPGKFLINLWSSIDVRDAASVCVAAIESEGLGAIDLNVVSDILLSNKSSQELIKQFYPNVPCKVELLENQPLVSNALAKKLLNWKPNYSWKNYN